jgi:two-component system, response regulator
MTGKLILLVEDNPDDIALTEIAFKKAKCSSKMIVVSNGQEALDFIFSQDKPCNRDFTDKPDLVLLDLNLPLVSGLEVLRRIRAHQETARIPVIILTSSSEDHDQSESRRLGANDYICKPTGLLQFVEIVHKIRMKWLD